MSINDYEMEQGESFIKFFALYVIFSLMAIHIAIVVINMGILEFSYVFYYNKLARCVMITALPYILVDLLYSLNHGKMKFPNIMLKVVLSTCLSLVLLRAMSEIKPQSGEDVPFTLYALGAYACIMMVWDICRNATVVFPGLVSRVLMVGDGRLAEDMRRLISSAGHRFQLVGSIRDIRSNPDNPESEFADIHETAKSLNADKVVISLAERRGGFPLKQMLCCKIRGIEVMDAPSLYERITEKLLIEDITPSWLIFSQGFKITTCYKLVKRAVDIVCSLFGLVVFAPFAPLVMLAIKLDSPGPILFSQERVGQDDIPFVLYKLRTMRQDAEKGTGAVWAAKVDPRVTRLGGILRKSRIDEIPQLINVLKGEMSLVGPRPERPEFVAKLKESIPYYSERHCVKPGVTGWAQVRYPYGASVQDSLEKLRYDLYYIKNISLIFDIRILFKTISVVMLGKGAR